MGALKTALREGYHRGELDRDLGATVGRLRETPEETGIFTLAEFLRIVSDRLKKTTFHLDKSTNVDYNASMEKTTTVRIDREVKKVLADIAKKNKRTLKQQIALCIELGAEEFAKGVTNGKIS